LKEIPQEKITLLFSPCSLLQESSPVSKNNNTYELKRRREQIALHSLPGMSKVEISSRS
jgi:hypothetical protein